MYTFQCIYLNQKYIYDVGPTLQLSNLKRITSFEEYVLDVMSVNDVLGSYSPRKYNLKYGSHVPHDRHA